MRQVQAIADLADELGLSRRKELFEFLVRSQSDIEGLRKCVKNSNKKPVLGLLEFRRQKMTANMMSVDDFKNRFSRLPRETLEDLFQHPVSFEEANDVISLIHSDKVSLDGIYYLIKVNPTMNLHKTLKVAM